MGPKETPITPDEWIAARFSAFTQPGSQVDCVGWCLDEGNVAAYPSQVIPELQYPTLLRWRKEGVDIAQRIVEESHRRKLEVFWEHRLNGADREADVTTPARHPLKVKHPEWLIDDGWWKPGLWNFAVPEVRDYKLAVLREVAERYDLDGLSLDFGRHPPFLPTGEQWEHRHELTAFVRQVRVMLQEVAEKRGRPLLLSVRVAETIPGCHFDGIDIETWVRQYLVDMIIIGTRSIEVDLRGFRRLTASSHVKLYPCIDQHHSPDGYHAVPSPEFLRGVAANWWHQGADGIATFNFWNDYLNLNHQAPLPLTLTADPAWVEVSVADDLAAQPRTVDRLELRLEISGEPAPGQLGVKFNGATLQDPQISDRWWVFKLTPAKMAVGRNLVTVDGGKFDERRNPITLEKVEVHVTYRSGQK